MRVLYVDDERLMLTAIKRQLERLGHEVVTADHPREDLRNVEVDVILADWNPHGPAMLDMARLRTLPVVVYSAAPPCNTGALTLTKPCSSDDLVAALKEAIRGT